MRIAMLGHKRIPSREGGVEVVVEELSVRMAAQGHEITCYNRSGHHVSGKEFDAVPVKEYKGVKLKIVPAIHVKGLAAMTASFFASVRVCFGPFDAVHFHTEGPCATLWLPKLFKKRCIATVHGLDHRRSKWGKFARAYILLGEKCAARFADEIIVLSKGVQDYFKKTYGRETRLIPNGVTPAERVPADLICNFGLSGEDYFLYLGRITPEKGIHTLIEAYQGLKTHKKLVIAGGASDSGSYFERLRQMAAGNENIIFTGFVQGQMLSELYSNAFAYVLPSEIEGMPLSLLEAMSYGNRCITSDIPESTDVTGPMGACFESGNAQSLRRRLAEAESAPAEHTRDEIAAYICAKYNWEDVVTETLAVYGEKCR